ncbi:hypothetical protein [Streptomyces sp. NPDC051677]|uniref:hypothetical protein n=1 Tax=Streptomyces sp. NPDC051677 TaxID=3365669 RepID=UPI0037D4B901
MRPASAPNACSLHTLTPTHPGWNGAHRPDRLTGVDDLALACLRHLHALGRLQVVPEAGHLPHVEQPEAAFALLDAHLHGTGAAPRPRVSRTSLSRTAPASA